MLTEDEKMRVRLEEQYRAEVRNSLTPKSGHSKTWAFLNSAFGLWLLSTGAVGFLTWGYQQLQQRHQEAQEAARKRNALIVELEYRLAPVDRLSDFAEILSHLRDLENDSPARWSLEQYKGRTLTSLMWELEALDDASDNSLPLLRSFQAIEKAANEATTNQDNIDRFRVFCYYWSQLSHRRFSGALRAPIGIVVENGRVTPLKREDLDRVVK